MMTEKEQKGLKLISLSLVLGTLSDKKEHLWTKREQLYFSRFLDFCEKKDIFWHFCIHTYLGHFLTDFHFSKNNLIVDCINAGIHYSLQSTDLAKNRSLNKLCYLCWYYHQEKVSTQFKIGLDHLVLVCLVTKMFSLY